MKHDWEDVSGGQASDMFHYGRRRCRNCGAEQTKESMHNWMRVVDYRWEPLVGRCTGKKEKRRAEATS